MMVVMFAGMGGASIFCGLVDSPKAMLVGLCGIGLFASIYHPVAIAWLVRNAQARGKALGFNGVFGSIGVAGSGFVTGALIDLYGWRAAFIVPGSVSLLTAAVLAALLARGVIVDRQSDALAEPPPTRDAMLRGFGVLLLTMFVVGLVFNATQVALPKVFSLRMDAWAAEGIFGIGVLVAAVYLISGIMQVIGGHLADRYPLKLIYLSGLLLQIPMLVLVAHIAGLPLVAAATLAVFLNAGVLPAENMLIARYIPEEHRGLAYGVKFVLAFASAPLAVMLVSKITELTGEFVWLYGLLAALMGVAFLTALLLPRPARIQAMAA